MAILYKIFNPKFCYFVLILFCCFLFGCSSFSPFGSLEKKEEDLEDYMTKTYDEWFVTTSVGFKTVESGISYFKGYFISKPDEEVQVDYLNGLKFSKYFWSYEESNPVYGDYLSGIINRYFEVSDYTIRMKRGARYQHFSDSMNMDEIIDYLKDNDLDIYFVGDMTIESQDSTLYAFEALCRILYNDLKDEGYHFDFNLRGVLENGTVVDAHFLNLKWVDSKIGPIFNHNIVTDKQESLSDVEASIDDLGDESELSFDFESKLYILDDFKEDGGHKNEVGPVLNLNLDALNGDRKGE